MVHLHARSCYSLLESSLRVERLVDQSAALGYRHVALTDKDAMFAAMKFYKYALSKNIHPILGLELDVQMKQGLSTFILLAKNDHGLQNLYALSTQRMQIQNTVTFEELCKRSADCVVISCGIQDHDILNGWILHDDTEKLKEYFITCQNSFPCFYAGIACNDSGFWRAKNIELKKLYRSLSIPTCALSYILYEKKEDVKQLRILKAIQKQARIHDQNLNVLNDRYIRSMKEMESLYDLEDLQNTEEIAKMCNVQMAMEKSHLPVFQNKLGIDSSSFLIKLCKAGLQKRLHKKENEVYTKRLEYELSVITRMGFTNYFLIVYDFIRFARTQGIYVGPGRGSAAGSLVAYCLGITHIDPIQNHLLFERFLNPDRVSMPDIDTDFPDDRRDEVIEYVKNLYGEQHVCHIVTFNTLKAKQVLRDVGRVYSISSSKIDSLTKLIRNVPNMTLRQAYQENTKFQSLVQKDELLKELYYNCLALEGLPRHISLHAAGIVLSNQPITNVCPKVQVDADNQATQFTMEYLEELGLIKMDFLGLRNLTTIDQIVKQIQKKIHQPFDILKIPLNDQRTYQLLARADTLGVFQLESSGIQSLLRKMKPSRFEDICAVLALYRPSAMHNIDLYIARKEDPRKIEYPHPLTRPILEETYGIMIYQEQVMQIARAIGNLSLAQADSLRKAMSKKNHEQMESYKELFIQGALQHQCTFKQANALFDTMAQFASYGFNKSHSYAYALIAYQMAYLKANYPLYFYQCLLDSVIGSETKTNQYRQECMHRHVKILCVDVNASQDHYHIENQALRMPLQVLKGIGQSIYPIILKERQNGAYKDYIDFVVRCNARKLTESSMRILIDGGALDSFGLNRATMHENLGRVLVYADLVRTEAMGQISFDFSVVSKPNLIKVKENKMERAKKEFMVYGFYLSQHPVQQLRQERFKECIPFSQAENKTGFMQVIGRVTSFRTHTTKQGEPMCFVSLEDETGKIDIVLMPALYAKEKNQIAKDRIVFVQGNKNRPQSIVARKLRWIDTES